MQLDVRGRASEGGHLSFRLLSFHHQFTARGGADSGMTSSSALSGITLLRAALGADLTDGGARTIPSLSLSSAATFAPGWAPLPLSACAGLSAGTCAGALSFAGSHCGPILPRPTWHTWPVSTLTCAPSTRTTAATTRTTVATGPTIKSFLYLYISVRVALKLRSLRFHSPHLCRIAVF